MGYVPPTTPHYDDLPYLFKAMLYENAATPQLRIVPPTRTYEDYRKELYGERTRDWLPFLGYGLIGALGALAAAVVWFLA